MIHFIYLFLVLFFVWMTFVLLFVKDFRKPSPRNFFVEKFSVIVPTFNEPVDNLRSTLVSVLESFGDKEVIVVNDGYVLVQDRRLISSAVYFSIFNFFVLQWLWIVGLFKLNDQKWMTR